MNSHIIHIHGPQASGKTTMAALIAGEEATWLASPTATWDIWRTIHDIDNSKEYTIVIDDLLIEEDILNPLFIHLNSPVVRDAYRVIMSTAGKSTILLNYPSTINYENETLRDQSH